MSARDNQRKRLYDSERALAGVAYGRHTLGGFSDATFTMVAAVEAGRDAKWEF